MLDSREDTTEENSQRAKQTANSNCFTANDLKVMYGDSGSQNYFLELLNETQFPFEIQVCIADATLQIHAEA
jgi:hypothetical protein